jgi:hypothetical protein
MRNITVSITEDAYRRRSSNPQLGFFCVVILPVKLWSLT